MQQDRQGNFYVRDKVASEDLIRQISPDGQVRTLISANGLTDFGYPAFQHSLKALLPPAQQIEEQVEYIMGFVVDRPRDWLYIMGKHLYRLDLRTQKLEQLGQQNFELAELTSRQAQYMDVDAAGHLYLPGHNQIYKVLIPQPEGR